MTVHATTVVGPICDIGGSVEERDSRQWSGDGPLHGEVDCPECLKIFDHVQTCPSCRIRFRILGRSERGDTRSAAVPPSMAMALLDMLVRGRRPARLQMPSMSPEFKKLLESNTAFLDSISKMKKFEASREGMWDTYDQMDMGPEPAYPAQAREIEESWKENDEMQQTSRPKIDVERGGTGTKLSIPEDMDLDDAEAAIRRRRSDEETVVEVKHELNMSVPEGALALHQSLIDLHGYVSGEAGAGGFFTGPTPPTFIPVDLGDRSVSVPWDDMRVPGIDGTITAGIRWEGGFPYFHLSGKVKGKHKHKVQRIADHIRGRTDRLYRGKAIMLNFPELVPGMKLQDFFPKIMSIPEEATSDKLILSRITERLVAQTIFTPIRYLEKCIAVGASPKRGILLEGPFGVGKTLTALVAARLCIENGQTFIYLKDVKSLPKAITFARQYQPAVIFAEDVDLALREDDEEGRTEEINAILNSSDGIDTKGMKLITIVTTNNVGAITQAMLRPGRLDTIIEMRAPDAEAAERLVRHYAGKQLAPHEDISEVSQRLAGCIPAMIREAVDRSKLGAVMRSEETGAECLITAEDIAVSATSMESHMRLLNGVKEREPSELELAAAVLGPYIERALSASAHRPNGHSPAKELSATA